MAAPRSSILNLFDPLSFNGPITPRRGANSPDSDKENSVPKPSVNEQGTHVEKQQQFGDFPMTAFFSRTYELEPMFDYDIKPMTRLVDVGDKTTDEDDQESVNLLGDCFQDMGIGQEREKENVPNLLEASPEINSNSRPSESTFESALLRSPPTSPTRNALLPSADISTLSLAHALLPFETTISSPAKAATPRTPLAELSVAHSPFDHSPLSRKKLFRREPTPPASPKSWSNSKTSPKTGSPLSSVVVSSCYSDDGEMEEELAREAVPTIFEEPGKIGEAEEVEKVTEDVLDTIREEEADCGDADEELQPQPASAWPEITFSLANNEDDDTVSSSASLAFECTSSRLVDVTSPLSKTAAFVIPEKPVALEEPFSSPHLSFPSVRPRTRVVNTSPLDPRRTSVDLLSSFSFQLNNPDSSFDLLNDRISFFGREGSSSFLDDDESFNLGKEAKKMEAALRDVVKDNCDFEESTTEEKVIEEEMKEESMDSSQSLQRETMAASPSSSITVALPEAPRPVNRHIRRPSVTPLTSAPVFVPPPKFSLASSSRLPSTGLSTPARRPPATVPPVPALKVVKRSKMTSSFSDTSVAISTVETIDQGLAASISAPVISESSSRRLSSSTESARGPARRVLRTSGIGASASSRHAPTRSLGNATVASGGSGVVRSSVISRRLSASVSAPNVMGKEETKPAVRRPISMTGAGGLKPAAMNTQASTRALSASTATQVSTTALGASATVGLRQPSKFGSSVSGTSTASALPKPSGLSKLPSLLRCGMKASTGASSQPAPTSAGASKSGVPNVRRV